MSSKDHSSKAREFFAREFAGTFFTDQASNRPPPQNGIISLILIVSSSIA